MNLQPSSPDSTPTGDSGPPRQPTAQANKRETTTPSIEEIEDIAERVYRLFCEELRRERERRGRWR